MEKIPEEPKEENESHSPITLKENKATKSSRPAQVLSIPRIRPRASTIENQEEEIPGLERPSPRVVQSRFIEDLDDVFVDDSPGVLASKSPNIQSKDETRRSSEGWLSGGKRLGYNYDFESKAPLVQAQENLPRDQYERVVSSPDSETSRDLELNAFGLETEPDIAAAEIHASMLKGPERSNKKSAALIPRLSGFMRRKVRQLSSADSDLTDVMLSEARGFKTHKADNSQTSGDNEEENIQESKGRQFFKAWKNPLTSSRRASNQTSPDNKKASPVDEFKETMPYGHEIETPKPSKGKNADVASSSAGKFHLYSESPPRLPLAPNQQTFSEDGFATGPKELPSAEDWSRMYEECVEYPPVDDELVSMTSGGSNVAQYARTIRENHGSSGSSSASNMAQYARTVRENRGGSGSSGVSNRAQYAHAISEDHVGSASSRGFNLEQYGRSINQTMEGYSGSNSTDVLRQSTTEFRLAQLAAEEAECEELLKMVNNTWV